MFKATIQECKEAQLGLVSAIMRVDPAVLEVTITNPILLGKSISDKDFYLDVKVTVNHSLCMNFEMQITNDGNWLERSVSYTARLYDNLNSGDDYKDVTPVHHIGFLTFDLFEDGNKFFDTFTLQNEDNSQKYTSKFKVSVVNLKCIPMATIDDKIYKLDSWAKLLCASTWEELKDVAKGDLYMEKTAQTLFMLSSDFDIRENARRRDEYYAKLRRLAVQDAIIADKDATISRQADEIAKLRKRLADYEAN